MSKVTSNKATPIFNDLGVKIPRSKKFNDLGNGILSFFLERI
jgi:hypothetical protein